MSLFGGVDFGNPTAKSTKPFFTIFGSFSSPSWRLPYFTANLSIKDAADYLKLASEIPGMDETDWKIEELYQRDIDWPRVDAGLVPWLREDTAKFFNAITVVLVPHRSGGLPFSASFDSTGNWVPPKPEILRLKDHQLEVGPVRFGFPENAFDAAGNLDLNLEQSDIGEVAWNFEQADAVAIDGQHRLAAVKELARLNGADHNMMSTKVPVIFLLFHEKLGFRSDPNEDSNKLLRRVFVDLNKHSVTPSRARVILLDDKMPQAFSVRSLMASTLSPNIDSLSENPPKLPLSLVDWHTEQAKFDKGPYVTTVLGLDGYVSEFLNLKDVKSFLDYSALRKQVKNLQTKLVLNLNETLTRIDALEQDGGMPFSFDSSELAKIQAGFADVFAPSIVRLLTEFKPYSDLIAIRDSNNTFSVEWQHWYRLFSKSSAGDPRAANEVLQYVKDLKLSIPPVPTSSFEADTEVIENFKKDNLAFAVIFQKSYILAFLDFLVVGMGQIEEVSTQSLAYSNSESTFDENDFEDEQEQEFEQEEQVSSEDAPSVPGIRSQKISDLRDHVDVFIRTLNKLVSARASFLSVTYQFDHGYGAKNFWQGSLLKSGGTIDFSQVAAKRAKELISSAVLIGLLKSTPTNVTRYVEFDDLWADMISNDSGSPALVKKLRFRMNAMISTNNPTGLAERILAQFEIDYDEDKARDEVRSRLLELWNSF